MEENRKKRFPLTENVAPKKLKRIGNPFHSKYKTYSLYDKCHN